MAAGVNLVVGGVTVGAGMAVSGGAVVSVGNAVVSPGRLLVTTNTAAVTALDVYSSSTGNVLSGRVITGSGGNILSLTEGVNTLLQVSAAGLASVGNNGLLVSVGSATMASGLVVVAGGATLTAGSLSVTGSLSVSASTATASGLAAYASTAGFTSDVILGQTVLNGNLLTLTDNTPTLLFQVRAKPECASLDEHFAMRCDVPTPSHDANIGRCKTLGMPSSRPVSKCKLTE